MSLTDQQSWKLVTADSHQLPSGHQSFPFYGTLVSILGATASPVSARARVTLRWFADCSCHAFSYQFNRDSWQRGGKGARWVRLGVGGSEGWVELREVGAVGPHLVACVHSDLVLVALD